MWCRLADCESGDGTGTPPYHVLWTYDDGLFEGGYNFSHSTWDAAKRLPSVRRLASQYAAAYDAPPYVQTRVAMAWLPVQGWDAWPTCSRRIGLR